MQICDQWILDTIKKFDKYRSIDKLNELDQFYLCAALLSFL